MSLPVSWNILLLSFLYFVQGIPYGFQSRFLPVYLRKSGMSLTNLTFFKLLLIPWLCKALWAPFVDKYSTKRNWLIWSMTGLTFVCALCSFITPDDLQILSAFLFLLNVFAATQDIAVDGIAIRILSSDELGQGNTAQVVGYKCGAIVGGGVLLWLIDFTGWSPLFSGLTTIYFLSVLFAFESKSLKNLKLIKTEDNCSKSTEKETGSSAVEEDSKTDMSYFGILWAVLQQPGTKWLLGLVLIYKLGEQGALSSLPLFLVDQDVSSADIGFWIGVVGQITSIFGSALGGFLLSKCRVVAHKLLHRLFIMQLLPLSLMLMLITFWKPGFFFLAALCMNLLLIISGLVTTTTFTLMMQCSQYAPVQIQGTHYTTLATVEVFGKLTFASTLGLFIDIFGYRNMYFLFIILSLIINPYLGLCPDVLRHNSVQKSGNNSKQR